MSLLATTTRVSLHRHTRCSLCVCVCVFLFSLRSQSGSFKHRRPGPGLYMSTVMRDGPRLGDWRVSLSLLHYHLENKPFVFCSFTQCMFRSLTSFHHASAGRHQFSVIPFKEPLLKNGILTPRAENHVFARWCLREKQVDTCFWRPQTNRLTAAFTVPWE